MILFGGFFNTTFAADEAQIKKYTDIVKDACHEMDRLHVRMKENGQETALVRFYVPVKDEQNSTVYLNCERFGIKPLPFQVFQQLKGDGSIVQCIRQEINAFNTLHQLSRDAQDSTNLISHGSCGPERPAASCGEEITCNLIRTAANAGTYGAYGAVTTAVANYSDEPGGHGCVGYRKSDCLTSFATGIFRSFFTKISSAFDFLKKTLESTGHAIHLGAKKVYQEIKSWFSKPEVQSGENHESEMLHLL